MVDFLPFKMAKYLKTLSVGMNISNTNKYCYAIFYTCINYNPPMNAVKFCHDYCNLLPLLFAQIGKIFKNFVCLGEYVKDNGIFLAFLFAQIDKILKNLKSLDEHQ